MKNNKALTGARESEKLPEKGADGEVGAVACQRVSTGQGLWPMSCFTVCLNEAIPVLRAGAALAKRP